MIRILLILICAAGAYADGLGQLKQPDGSSTPIGVSSELWGQTYMFPVEAIPSRSWLVLPGVVSVAVLTTAAGRTTLPFPKVHAPDVRFAVEVPAGLLSLTVHGTATNGLLQRLDAPPEDPDHAWVIRSDRTTVTLPRWKSRDTVGITLLTSGNASWAAELSDGTQTKSFEFQPAVKTWTFFPAAWGFVPRTITVTGSDVGFDLRLRAFPAAADIAADPATILTWPREAWRSPRREWFTWDSTSVLILVTADYRVQDDYLKRLAFFVEKTGFRGRIVSDAEVANLHGWNAHDYAAPDLARFFSQAQLQKVPLNASEIELRGRLADAGVIRKSPEGWEAGTGALVGVSAESPPALRAVLFVHEAFHGLYYTSPEFRAGVHDAWQALSEDTRTVFRKFLSLSRYDPSDEALMINEFQAYTLQRHAAEWPAFFGERVLAAVPASNRNATRLSEFLTAARAIDALVGKLYGLGSGSVALLRQTSR